MTPLVTMSEIAARRYRFAPLHRAGLFGAIAPTLLVTLAIGVLAGWVAVISGAPAPVAVAPLGLTGFVAFGRVGGRPIHELIPRAVGWGVVRGRRRNRWHRAVPLTGGATSALPAALDGVQLFDGDGRSGLGRPRTGGVVRDRHAGTVTAIVRVHGDGGFGLADPAIQDNRLDLWGLALAGFCREALPVVRVAWHDWTSPTGIGDHITDVRTRWDGERESAARGSYLRLVEAVAPASVRHEVLVAVTVDLRKVGRKRKAAGLDIGLSTLLDELRLFIGRLEHGGLACDPALSAAEISTATRVRSDPASLAKLTTLRRSLASAASQAAPDFEPMAIAEDWNKIRVDGGVHRSWWVARWPRREVPAGWLDQVLFGLPCTRTLTVVFEPISPSRSDRDIDRESVARTTNADDKARRGFRVKAADRKAARDVEMREAELNEGFGELSYVGLLTITVADPAALDAMAATVEQVAAQSGVELLSLFGRQSHGWVASLPLGRTIARRLT